MAEDGPEMDGGVLVGQAEMRAAVEAQMARREAGDVALGRAVDKVAGGAMAREYRVASEKYGPSEVMPEGYARTVAKRGNEETPHLGPYSVEVRDVSPWRKVEGNE